MIAELAGIAGIVVFVLIGEIVIKSRQIDYTDQGLREYTEKTVSYSRFQLFSLIIGVIGIIALVLINVLTVFDLL